MMRLLLIFCIACQAFGGIDPLLTSRMNKAKEAAENAFVSQNYDQAIRNYKYLLDTLKAADPKALLNLAHAYMRKADYDNARKTYSEVTKTDSKPLSSIAYQQLGILDAEKNKRDEAKLNFKKALQQDPDNLQARHNYELLLRQQQKKDLPKSQDKKERDKEEQKNQDQKKKEEEQKKEQQKKQDKQNKQDQKDQNKDGQEKEKGGTDKNKEGDNKEQQKKEDENGKLDPKEKGKENKPGDNSDKKPAEDGKEKDSAGNGKKQEDDDKKGEKGKETKDKQDEKGDKKGTGEKPSDKGEKKKNTDTEQIAVNKDQLKEMNMSEHQAKALLNAMRQGEVQYIQQIKRTPSKPHAGKGKPDW